MPTGIFFQMLFFPPNVSYFMSKHLVSLQTSKEFNKPITSIKKAMSQSRKIFQKFKKIRQEGYNTIHFMKGESLWDLWGMNQ